jgi:hypothetical protein
MSSRNLILSHLRVFSVAPERLSAEGTLTVQAANECRASGFSASLASLACWRSLYVGNASLSDAGAPETTKCVWEFPGGVVVVHVGLGAVPETGLGVEGARRRENQ